MGARASGDSREAVFQRRPNMAPKAKMIGSTEAAQPESRQIDQKGTFKMNNEQIVRRAYQVAEKVDLKGWVDCFTPDGTFTDMSIGVTYRGSGGPTGLDKTVEVYAKAF